MKHFARAIVVLLVAGLGAPDGKAASPRAVQVARTTTIPTCGVFVDAAAATGGSGTASRPYETIAAAVAAAAPGAVICVADGTYAETLAPGTKPFTLAGGFQHGSGFAVRDSARHVSKAQGNGGIFLRIVDPGPNGAELTAIDGFEITGYEQAIVRDYYETQRFDITNNFIHDNRCRDTKLVGAGFALNNVSGTISGNVFARNACGRGGAGALNDGTNKNAVTIENNLIDGNAGTELDASHGGGLYLFANKLGIFGNTIIDNSVKQWGGGIYIGAYNEGGQHTTATLSRNVYRGNRAGSAGGGLFCDDGATCLSTHELYEKNCGGNIYLDSGGGGPTVAEFDHLTNVEALDTDCRTPGAGVRVDAGNNKADTYTFTNSFFSGNAAGRDFVTGCSEDCKSTKAKVTVSHSTLQRDYVNGGIEVTFGEGIVPPSGTVSPKAETSATGRDPASGLPATQADRGRTEEGNGAAGGTAEDGGPKRAVESKGGGGSNDPAAPAPATAARTGTEPVEGRAPASAGDISVGEAFQAAKELGTVEAWNIFLKRFPNGFRADLARAYLKKLQSEPVAPAVTR